MNESSALQAPAPHQAPPLRKRIPVASPSFQGAPTKFQQSLRQLTSLRHQNIEAVHEVHFNPPKDCYLLCERIEGDSLAEILERERRLPLEVVRSITRQAASALTAAHDLGLTHGNLSPSAIMIQRPASADAEVSVKVRDFGLAKVPVELQMQGGATGVLAPQFLTKVGSLYGTPGYMAPEQALSEAVDSRADLYSLGAIMYEMLSGRTPFDGNTAPLIMLKHLNNQPPELAKLNPKVPPALCELIARTLRKAPKERPAMSEVAEGLLGLCDRQLALRLAPTPLSLSSSGQVPLPGRISGQVTAVTGQVTPAPARPSGQVTAVRESYEDLVVEAEAPLPAHKTTAFTRRRPLVRRLLIGLLVLSVGAGVGGYFLQTRVLSHGQKAKVVSAAPEPALVQVGVRSEPPGAMVLRQPDQLPLGRTPWLSKQPRGGVLRLTLRLPGYLDREVILFLDQDGERTERLDRAPGQPGVKEPPRRPAAPNGPRRTH